MCLPSAHVVCVCVVWWCAQCVQVLWGLVVVCSYVRERKILSVTAYVMCVYVCVIYAQAHEHQQRHAKKAEERAAREAEKTTKAEVRRQEELKQYKSIMKVGQVVTSTRTNTNTHARVQGSGSFFASALCSTETGCDKHTGTHTRARTGQLPTSLPLLPPMRTLHNSVQ